MHMTSFSDAVLAVVKTIPKGTVLTYRDVAAAIGRPRAVRAVGQSLHYNPFVGTIPCHRVVKSSGEVGGYVHGRARKVALLRSEGVAIQNGVIDLSAYRYKAYA